MRTTHTENRPNQVEAWSLEHMQLGTLDIFKLMRGRRSQLWLSKRLGYQFNKVGRWENGNAVLMWGDFVDAAEVLKIDVEAPLSLHIGYKNDPRAESILVPYLTGGLTDSAVCEQLSITPRQLKELLRGSRKLRFVEFLKLVELNRFDFFGFLGCITNVEEIAAFRGQASQWLGEQSLCLDHPATYGVVRCLELLDYAEATHATPGYIARRLGITVEEELKILSQLEQLGLARRQGRLFKLTQQCKHSFYLGGRDTMRWNLIRYWTQRAVDVVTDYCQGSKPKDDVWCFRVIASSPETYEELRQRTISYVKSLQEVFDRECTDPNERLSVLNIQLFDPSRSSALR